MYRLALRKSCKDAVQRSFQQQSNKQYSKGLPPNVQEAGFGKVIFVLTPFVAVGGAVTYAKYDKEFRKILEQNVPGAEKIIKIALQEEKPFTELTKQFDSTIDTVKNQFNNVSQTVDSVTSTVTGFFGGGSSTTTQKVKETVKEIPKKIEETKITKSSTGAQPITTSKSTSEVKPSKTEPAKAAAKAPQLAELPKNILDLEKSVEHAASVAVKEYNEAIKVLKVFNNDVRQVVDQAVENLDPALWTSLKNKTSARDSSIDTAEKSARLALDKIHLCEIALSKATNADNHDQVVVIRNKIKGFLDHINTVKDELYKEKDLASVSEKYWRNVEKARHYFIEEMESIFPGLNLSAKKLDLSKDDLDLFITHAYSHVLAYQKELQRLQTDGELRLKRAVDAFRGDSDNEAIKSQLEYLLETEKQKLAIDNQKRILQIRTEADKQLRQQLKQQAEAHIDHINEAVRLKEVEVKRNYSRDLEDKLQSEKANYKLQLATMLGKLRGMDAALQARAESERSAHQAQSLWAACQALWASVRTGEPGAHWKDKLRPLKREIHAVAKVAEGDELVAVVLQNLPREAEERGVFPEDALRERFLNVERVARKLALVPEEGASIPVYVLSYLQSLFILRPSEPISKDELQNKKFDFSKLDTYDILNRARYFVDRGDLLQALKYMNLLQGAPRNIAKDWLKETRLLLETQQAANTLMAHAASSGLLYL